MKKEEVPANILFLVIVVAFCLILVYQMLTFHHVAFSLEERLADGVIAEKHTK